MKKIVVMMLLAGLLLSGCRSDYQIVDELPMTTGVDDGADIDDLIPEDVVEDYSIPEYIAPDDPLPTYEPGTYSGTGAGYGGELTVEVTVDEYFIKEIDVVSHSESEGYIPEKTQQFLEDMIANNSMDVDAVSGATESCDGILSAVLEALEAAAL